MGPLRATVLPHEARIRMVVSHPVSKALTFLKLNDRFLDENITPTWAFEG